MMRSRKLRTNSTADARPDARGRRRQVSGLFGIGLLCVCLIGCTGSGSAASHGEVQGTVTLQGEPLREGYVAFTSPAKGVGAGGRLNSAGEFQLDGTLPVGSYVVIVTPPPAGDPLSSPSGSETPASTIPTKYRAEATTDLKADIQSGRNTLSFDLQPDHN